MRIIVPGARVELHPAADLWMRGCRFGTVTKVGLKWISVHFDQLRNPVRVRAENLTVVE
jgi:hypothetical protein